VEFFFEGKTDLHFLEGTMDAAAYQQILQKYLVNTELSDDFKVLQDGAPPHTATSTWEFIDEAGIEMIQDPPGSPELNPIENVWGWIKDKINSENPRTLVDLKARIQFWWDNIPQTTIQQFISHNKTVCNDIVVAGGGTIAEEHRPKLQRLR
jgi:transposase